MRKHTQHTHAQTHTCKKLTSGVSGRRAQASLAAFIGAVQYSDTFGVAAAAQTALPQTVRAQCGQPDSAYGRYTAAHRVVREHADCCADLGFRGGA